MNSLNQIQLNYQIKTGKPFNRKGINHCSGFSKDNQRQIDKVSEIEHFLLN